VPTVRGTFVTTIHDTSGIGWTVVSTKFVSGEVLEDLDNPAPYYETIGSWAALFHEQSRHWEPPYGFQRFNWDLSNMGSAHPRAGVGGRVRIWTMMSVPSAKRRYGRRWTWS
jgi:hypothetical protein